MNAPYKHPARLLVLGILVLSLFAMFAASFHALSKKNTMEEAENRPADTRDTMSGMSMPPGNSAFNLPDEKAGEVAELMTRIKAAPNDAQSLLRLAEIFMDAEEWPRAETFLTRAMLARPSDTLARYMLGICQFRQNRPADAAVTFEDLLKIEYIPPVAYNLAMLYSGSLNQPEKARTLLEKLIQTPNVEPSILERAKADLAELPKP